MENNSFSLEEKQFKFDEVDIIGIDKNSYRNKEVLKVYFSDENRDPYELAKGETDTMRHELKLCETKLASLKHNPFFRVNDTIINSEKVDDINFSENLAYKIELNMKNGNSYELYHGFNLKMADLFMSQYEDGMRMCQLMKDTSSAENIKNYEAIDNNETENYFDSLEK